MWALIWVKLVLIFMRSYEMALSHIALVREITSNVGKIIEEIMADGIL